MRSGRTRSTPGMSGSGNMMPTSSTRMRPSTSMQAQFRPISPRPPRKTIRTERAPGPAALASAPAAGRRLRRRPRRSGRWICRGSGTLLGWGIGLGRRLLLPGTGRLPGPAALLGVRRPGRRRPRCRGVLPDCSLVASLCCFGHPGCVRGPGCGVGRGAGGPVTAVPHRSGNRLGVGYHWFNLAMTARARSSSAGGAGALGSRHWPTARPRARQAALAGTGLGNSSEDSNR